MTKNSKNSAVVDEKSKNQDQNFSHLKEQIENLTCELLKERITRIDFQMQLLAQWRQQCQQELNQKESSQKPES